MSHDAFGLGIVVRIAASAHRANRPWLASSRAVDHRCILGGFNWSSQHLDGGICDDRLNPLCDPLSERWTQSLAGSRLLMAACVHRPADRVADRKARHGTTLLSAGGRRSGFGNGAGWCHASNASAGLRNKGCSWWRRCVRSRRAAAPLTPIRCHRAEPMEHDGPPRAYSYCVESGLR